MKYTAVFTILSTCIAATGKKKKKVPPPLKSLQKKVHEKNSQARYFLIKIWVKHRGEGWIRVNRVLATLRNESRTPQTKKNVTTRLGPYTKIVRTMGTWWVSNCYCFLLNIERLGANSPTVKRRW